MNAVPDGTSSVRSGPRTVRLRTSNCLSGLSASRYRPLMVDTWLERYDAQPPSPCAVARATSICHVADLRLASVLDEHLEEQPFRTVDQAASGRAP